MRDKWPRQGSRGGGGLAAQFAAETLLPSRRPIQAQIERLEGNQRAAEHDFGPERLLPREGGWSLALRLPDGEDEEELAHRLLVDDHVVIPPGFFYDFPKGEHLVVSLLPPANEFGEAVKRAGRRIEVRASGVRRQG